MMPFTVINAKFNRMMFMGLFTASVFAVLLLRILLLQTVDFDRYQEKVINQITTESVINAKRGDILDADGKVIATNKTAYRVFISPRSIAKADTESVLSEAFYRRRYGMSAAKVESGLTHTEFVARGLSDILGLDYENVLKQTTYVKYLDRTVARNINEEKAQLVRAFIEVNDLDNEVYLEAVSVRHYNYGSRCSSVVGFTSSDGVGLYGLENVYNTMLSGTNGKYVTARDALGNEMPFEYESYIEPKDGYTLITTLNMDVQAVLEEQLLATLNECQANNRACGIVMNVKTGGVLAMATVPTFDANDAWTLIDYYQKKLDAYGYTEGSEDYNKTKQELMLEMWSNKAITESYIPGSTFKVITASMALQDKVVTVDTPFSCSGSYVVAGVRIHCHKLVGHGALNFAEGIKQSCNPVLMQVGERIGATSFYNHFKAFGYLEKTGIDLPGEGSSIFHKLSGLNPVELATSSFGQNFNITVIQQICGISAVANGGFLVTPHIVEKIVDDNGTVIKEYGAQIKRQVVSTDVCTTVTEILEDGVSGEGGAKNCYVAGYKIAAKTGTSEKKGTDRDGNSLEGKYICSCIAFAPADDPQYAVILMVDEPTVGTLYGSTVAAPYIANIMGQILPILGVTPEYSEEELAELTISVPAYNYWSPSLATAYAQKAGFDVTVIGEGDYVKQQIPESGQTVEKENARIIFYLGDEKPVNSVTVPNLVGKTALAANQTLVNLGLNVKIAGTKNYKVGSGATVVSQSPAAGTQVPRGTPVTVEFMYLEDRD